MGALHVTGQNFEAEVLKSDLPVLADFWAEWCGPCKVVAPMIDEIADEKKDVLRVVKINVDEAQDLASKYNVMSIPTLMLFKGGEMSEQFVGAMSKDALLKKLEGLL